MGTNGLDIFNASPTFGGAFAMDEATLTFSIGNSDGSTGGEDDGGLGMLIQSVSMSYARPVQRFYELGPHKRTYYVSGRPEGRAQISRLSAPQAVSAGFLKRFSDVCTVDSHVLNIAASPAITCNGTGFNSRGAGLAQYSSSVKVRGNNVAPSRNRLEYCLIDSLNLNIAVQALALTESVSLVYAAHYIESDSSVKNSIGS